MKLRNFLIPFTTFIHDKLLHLVTIVITYVDELDFLPEALASVLKQQVSAEIVMVCNQRPEPTQWPDVPSGVTFLHEPIPGSAFARNKGLQYAGGEWIQFLDVDDLLLPDKINHQLSVSHGDIIISPHIYQYVNGQKVASRWMPGDLWVGLLNSGIGSTSSMLWRTKKLSEIGGWNINYQSHQEYELLFRAATKGLHIVPCPHADTIVRERKTGSITQMTKAFRAEEGIRLRQEIWQYLVEKGMDTPERFNAFRQYIFKQLRATYRRDKKGTMDLFQKYFSQNKFMPEETGIPFYQMIYSVAGFRNTENLFKFYAELRDKFMPFLPTNK